jgi:hypothetical protein
MRPHAPTSAAGWGQNGGAGQHPLRQNMATSTAARGKNGGAGQAPPASKPSGRKRDRKEAESVFEAGFSGPRLYQKRRTPARPQSRIVSRDVFPMREGWGDVTEMFDGEGTEIYAGDTIQGDGSVLRGREWHARMRRKATGEARRPKRPTKKEPSFRRTSRGIQILVPYQYGSQSRWIPLETASFDEMNRVAAVEMIEPGTSTPQDTVEDIESRYREAIKHAANAFLNA